MLKSKFVLVVSAVLFLSLPVYSQKTAAASQTVSGEVQLEIRNAQHEQDQVNQAYAQLNNAIQQAIAQQQLQAKGQKAQVDLKIAVDRAFKEAGKDQAKEDLNLDTFTFQPKPPQPGIIDKLKAKVGVTPTK